MIIQTVHPPQSTPYSLIAMSHFYCSEGVLQGKYSLTFQKYRSSTVTPPYKSGRSKVTMTHLRSVYYKFFRKCCKTTDLFGLDEPSVSLLPSNQTRRLLDHNCQVRCPNMISKVEKRHSNEILRQKILLSCFGSLIEILLCHLWATRQLSMQASHLL